jgi:two-component system, NtrC family, sensor kinase
MAVRRRLDPAGPEEFHRFAGQFGRLIEQIDDPTKLHKAALGQIARHLGADGGAVILRHPISGDLRTVARSGSGNDWHEPEVRAFLELRHPSLPPTEIMAPILVGGRPIGVMALRRGSGTFPLGAGRLLAQLCRKLAHEAALREERRVNRIVDQIKDTTVRELRPKDLFYQILHGLKALTRYDHSSAILIAEEDGARLVLHAEQIAWDKRKSDRIGKRVRVPAELRPALLRSAAIRTVPFGAGRGRGSGPGAAGAAPPSAKAEAGGTDLAALGRLLRWGGRGQEPAEGSILLAPLHHDGELLGVLKIAATRTAALGTGEAEVVGRVTGHIATVIHNARRALSMEERIIAAEKKHAMADLARAISHDVKNAIGAILPLAQQAREEVQTGTFDRKVIAQDLAQIEQSAQICQRIFDGMLQIARSGMRPVERAPLSKIIEGALSVLGTRLKRAGVTLELKLPDNLPEVNVSRGGLEQLFLNLFTNALESMPAGGKLKVQARPTGARLEVKVTDTGSGIPQELLQRIHEPFYTTKDEGLGLGLAICRTILWESGGEMAIESQPERGTIVTVMLPAADPRPTGTPARDAATARQTATERGAPPAAEPGPRPPAVRRP